MPSKEFMHERAWAAVQPLNVERRTLVILEIRSRDQRGYVVVVTGVLYGTTRRSSHPVEEILSCFLFSSALFAFAAASFFSRALSPETSSASAFQVPSVGF